jgi:hypothetical protein
VIVGAGAIVGTGTRAVAGTVPCAIGGSEGVLDTAPLTGLVALDTAPALHAVRKGAALSALSARCTTGEDEAYLDISDLEIRPAEAEAEASEGTCTGGGRTGGCSDGPGSPGGRLVTGEIVTGAVSGASSAAAPRCVTSSAQRAVKEAVKEAVLETSRVAVGAVASTPSSTS